MVSGEFDDVPFTVESAKARDALAAEGHVGFVLNRHYIDVDHAGFKCVSTACPAVYVLGEAVTGFTQDGVVDANGDQHEVDVVIFCCGSEAAELPIAKMSRGKDYQLVKDVWAQGSEAYGGTSVSGYPNMFLLNGPHVGLGAGSIIFTVETQANYEAESLQEIVEKDLQSLGVKADRQDEFIDYIGIRAANTVWSQRNCQSWYLDSRSGRLTTIWPDQINYFHSRFSTFNTDDYGISKALQLQKQ